MGHIRHGGLKSSQPRRVGEGRLAAPHARGSIYEGEIEADVREETLDSPAAQESVDGGKAVPLNSQALPLKLPHAADEGMLHGILDTTCQIPLRLCLADRTHHGVEISSGTAGGPNTNYSLARVLEGAQQAALGGQHVALRQTLFDTAPKLLVQAFVEGGTDG